VCPRSHTADAAAALPPLLELLPLLMMLRQPAAALRWRWALALAAWLALRRRQAVERPQAARSAGSHVGVTCKGV